jgi:tyrosyl-tRNA synthetase
LLVKASLASSKSEGRRLIRQGGVSVDGQMVGDERAVMKSDNFVIKVGKRRFARFSKA